MFDLDGEFEPIASGLGEAVRVDVPVDVPGATWFHPHTIPALRPGTQIMVFARLASPARSFAVTIGTSARSVPVRPATPALLERAAARVEIDELEATLAATSDPAARAKLAKQIEARSVASRVVSTQTAMLVLDSDDDYARYGIDRDALADILIVGPHGLEQSHRTFVASHDRPRHHSTAPLDHGDLVARARAAGSRGSTMEHEGLVTQGFGAGASYGVAHGSMRARTASVPEVHIGQAMVVGSLDKNLIRRYLHRHLAKITYCYEHELLARPRLHGTVQTRFTIGPQGHVLAATATGFDDQVASCVARVLEHVEFPPVVDSTIIVNYPFTFRTPESPPEVDSTVALAPAVEPRSTTAGTATPDPPAPAPVPAPPPAPASPSSPAASPTSPAPPLPTSPAATPSAPARHAIARGPAGHAAADPEAGAPAASPASPAAAPAAVEDAAAAFVEPAAADPGPTFGPPASALAGKLRRVMAALADHDTAAALALALAWRDAQPTDVLALVGLGEAFEARGDRAAAARAYGSIIDLYPTRAEFRRFAGERLERLGATGRALAIDTYRRAVADRPDQLTGHRLLAYALVRGDDYAGAFAAILAGVDRHAPEDRFAGAPRVFARDAGMIAAAYLAHGGNRAAIDRALARRGLARVTDPSTRVLLYWETDANDVDLHIRDAVGGHAWFSHKQLESGGELYADVTTGFGPECFEIVGRPSAGPYRIGVHYYAQGPMGYGMGLVQIERFDGKTFTFDDRPYVIMKDDAHVALGGMLSSAARR